MALPHRSEPTDVSDQILEFALHLPGLAADFCNVGSDGAKCVQEILDLRIG